MGTGEGGEVLKCRMRLSITVGGHGIRARGGAAVVNLGGRVIDQKRGGGSCSHAQP